MSNLLEEFGAGQPKGAGPSPSGEKPGASNPEGRSMLGRIASDVGTGLTEMVPAVGSGITRGLNEVSQAAFEAGNWLNKNVADLGTVEIGQGGIKWRSGQPEENQLKIPESVQPPRPTTVTGGIGEGVAQFLTGYVLGGKLLKGAGMTAARFAPSATTAAVVDATATTAGKLAYGGARSMFSGAAAFDPSEERLSNFINEETPFGFAATEYLAASPDDSRAEGRFKNALENVILDVPLEALFYAVKGIKAKRAGDLKGAQALAEQVERELDKGVTSTEAVPRDTTTPAGTAAEPEQIGEINFGRTSTRNRKITSSPYDPEPNVTKADGKIEPYASPFDWGARLADYLLAQYGKLADDPNAMEASARQRLFTNMRYVRDENDAKALANEFGKIAYQSFVKAKGETITHADVVEWAGKQIDELADATGTDVRELALRMNADRANLEELAQRVAGYRAMVAQYSRRATDLANAYKKGDLSEFGGDMNEWRKAFLQTSQTLYAIAPQTEGIKSGLGRNLALLQAQVGPEGKPSGALPGISADAKAASKEASPKAQVGGKIDNAATAQAEVAGAQAGDQKAVEALVERLARIDNPKAAKKVVDDAFGPGAMDVNNELWINALLSGPKTHIVNLATSTFKSALVMPGEQMIAGILSRDMEMFMMGADQYAGFFMSMKDALRQARTALRHNSPVLDPGSQGFGGTVGGNEGIINATTFGLNTDTPLGALVSGFGQLVRLPSRLLTTEDEFLKQLNYRARLYAMATREAREMRRVHKATDEELGKFVAEFVERGFDENGAAINAEALAWARDATFTNDLSVETWRGGRSIGESLNAFAANHPGFRMVMPFIRVPANIMRDVWDHTPGMNLLRRQYRAELEAGGERAAMAKAKMATGSAMLSAATMMALNGDIVGGLSSDPKVRRQQQEAGIIPFSIRVRGEDGKDRYYSYERLDPYATFFSTVATFADVASHIDDWKMEDLATSMVTALAKNIESKTYLQGLTEILGAVSDPDSKAEAFFKKRAASYVPSITNTFKGADYLSDPHNVAQAMLARTAGYGEVDPRYNLVGERVQTPKGFGPDWLSPITVGETNDAVLSELARLSNKHKGGLGYPSKTRSGGLDLDLTQFKAGDQTAYGRVQELSSEVRVGGVTLRDRLSALFASDRYNIKLTDGEPGIPGSKLTEVQATIEAYRQAAFGQLSKENPEFAAAYRAAQIKRVQMQRFGAQQ